MAATFAACDEFFRDILIVRVQTKFFSFSLPRTFTRSRCTMRFQ
jgi:hypothetical protein